jgi:oligopeptide transport system ATP-binding protein
MQIGKQIMEGLRIHNRKMKRGEAEARVVGMLGMVGIPNPDAQFKRYAYELSGGMRQRVVIAMAIVCGPRLLIADEPTTALDVTTQAQILDLIRSLKTTLKTSVMLITHDMGVVANMADKIAVFYAGQIVEEGAADDVFRDPSHPYTFALMACRPRLDRDRGQKLVSLGGAPPDLFAPPAGCVFFDRCDTPMEICEDNPPPSFETGGCGHRSFCWLHHEFGAARKNEWKTRAGYGGR